MAFNLRGRPGFTAQTNTRMCEVFCEVASLPAGVVNDGPLAPGAFYRSALLELNDHSPAIAQTEVFGPILVVHAFDSEDECKASLITSSAAMHRCGYAGGKQKGAQLS
ncbi:aldehyde dehydrogenase family protein [Paraburkholderia sp. JPY419]|uniref:aldehyde dehydrogenase family protein n=1 Tax=Paraburkholderia sp. JPY419 TaxID=667660 RepID=UPI003D25A8F0